MLCLFLILLPFLFVALFVGVWFLCGGIEILSIDKKNGWLRIPQQQNKI